MLRLLVCRRQRVFRRQFSAAAAVQVKETPVIKSKDVRPLPLPTTTKLRRFWKSASVNTDDKDFHSILLDNKRQLKSPAGNELKTSSKALAHLMAAEWEDCSDSGHVRPHAFPLTSLLVRATDDFAYQTAHQEQTDFLLNYLHTDTICYQAREYPEKLVQMQTEHWDPLHSWMREQFQIDLHVSTGLFGIKQDSASVEKLRSHVSAFPPLKMACFERAVLTSKSFVIALALVEKQISAERAMTCARVESLSQIHKWGMVEDTHDVETEYMLQQLASSTCYLW